MRYNLYFITDVKSMEMFYKTLSVKRRCKTYAHEHFNFEGVSNFFTIWEHDTLHELTEHLY